MIGRTLLVLCLCIGIAGCSLKSDASAPVIDEKQYHIHTTKSYGREDTRFFERLYTVEHDGHHFVIHADGYGSSMIHSPGCACLNDDTQQEEGMANDD